MSTGARPPVVAGLFYSADPDELRHSIHGYLAEARAGDTPRALIVPHAGYVYSAPVAASAFATLHGAGASFRRVMIVGPSHFVRFHGLALPGGGGLSTPLGTMPADAEGEEALRALSFVRVLPEAHVREHCIEVELPFLHELLGILPVIAVVTGDATAEQVAEAMDAVWDEETLLVVSSDLSHYRTYNEARRKDRATAEAILEGDIEALDPDSACGRLAVKGLLLCAQRRELRAELLDLRNSGDTAGPRDQVVGYGAFAVR